MRYPAATAAAAAETCKNERRERQAGFSSTGMVHTSNVPLACRELAPDKLTRTAICGFAICMHFLACKYLQLGALFFAALQKIQRIKRETRRRMCSAIRTKIHVFS